MTTPRSKLNAKKVLHKAIAKANALYSHGNIKEALVLTQKSLLKFPKNPNLLQNAGGFAGMINDLPLAENYTRQSLAILPNNADLHNNLGFLLYRQDCFEQAIQCYQTVLKLNPNHVDGHNNLGLLLQERQQLNNAKQHYQTALKINPNHVSTHNNFALLLQKQQHFDEAKQHYQTALKINPNYVEAHCNLGLLLAKQKYFDGAKQHYQAALKLQPNYIDIRWSLSLLLLQLGEFKQGWCAYEVRYHSDKKDRMAIPPKILTPRYQGEYLMGKSILIWGEQGIGDEIMFASVLSDLTDTGAKITLACDGRLVALFNRSFAGLTAIATDIENRYQTLAPNLDYHCAIGSLPQFYRNDIKDFEKHKPYLKVDNELLAKWQDRYSKLDKGMNIGISWFGGEEKNLQQERSITLQNWLPILKHKANFINLQYGDHQSEITAFEQQNNITIHDWKDANPLKDLDNFSAQIKALDLVIAIDNSTIHFAGALGTKTWVMLPYNQEWRWAEGRQDSYWYPNIIRLFRQTTYGDWGEVIKQVVIALAKKLA